MTKSDTYSIREPVILCLRQICMVSGNLATNSSGHIVPKSDTYGIRESVILYLREICMVIGYLASTHPVIL